MPETQIITSSEVSTNENGKFKFASLIPYSGTFIIFLGIVRLVTYYENFGIQILSFLEISEVITSFFDIILFVIAYSVGALMVTLSFTNSRKEAERLSKKWGEIYNESSFKRWLRLYFIHCENVIGAFFGVAVPVISWHIYNRFVLNNLSQPDIWEKLLFLLLILIGIFVVQAGFNELNYKLYHEKPTTEKQVTLAGVFLIFFSFIFIYLQVFSEVKSVREEKKFIGVTIKTEKSTFVSDSLNYYIGKTNNFLFIHHQDKNVTDVIPMAKVTELSFPNTKK